MTRASKICGKPTPDGSCIHIQPCPAHPRVAWQGSTRSRELPSNWAKLRRYVLDRDPICTACNRNLSTEVHHTGDRNDHNPDRLAGICEPCHKRETQMQAAAARRSS